MSIAKQMMKDAGMNPDENANISTQETDAEKEARLQKEAEAEKDKNKPGAEGAPAGEEKPAEETDEEKEARLTAEKEAAEKSGAPGSEEKPAGEGAPAKPELTPESVLEYLKAQGIEASSIDDLKKPSAGANKSPEEIEEEKKKFKDDAVGYALRSKLITSGDLEKYGSYASKTAREIALELFTETVKAANPESTPEEVEEMFSAYYAESDNEPEWLRTMKATEMENVAKSFVNSKFNNVINADKAYSGFLELQRSAETYKNTVTQVIDGFPKEVKFDIPAHIEVEGLDKTLGFSFAVAPETLEAIKADMLSMETFRSFGQSNPKSEHIANVVLNSIYSKHIKDMVIETARSYSSKILESLELSRKAIPAGTALQGSQASETTRVTSVHAKKMLEEQAA